MLRSFRLGNHRSFRSEQELLLMPSYDKENQVVPVAAVYGANASGKSNLLNGLRFMASAVRDSFARWRPEGGVPRRPFKLDPAAAAEPSTFVVELVIDDVRYTYGFVVDDARVREEWLYSYPEKRRRIMFERDLDRVKFGSASQLAKLDFMVDLLRPNALFLSLAAQSNVRSLLPVYQWFDRGVAFLDSDATDDFARVVEFVKSNPGLLVRMSKLLRVADLGISGVLIEDVPSVETLVATRDRIIAELDEMDTRSRPEEVIHAELQRLMAAISDNRQQMEVALDASRRLQLAHGAAREPFDLDEESAGTRAWLAILPIVLTVLRDGGTLVVDEIDTSLHPVLVLRLVKLFHDKATNDGGAQLIFTTHDATLLHPPLAEEGLARDEIWFVEKDSSGASMLYPLTDFSPRSGDNLERRYLSGRYGAVPNVLEADFAAAVRGARDVEA